MLNVAILAAGIGLFSADVPAVMPIAVFLLGATSAIVAILASATQHDYYRNVRDLKERLERRLGLGDLALATTPGMGGPRTRIASLTTFQKFILGCLLLADLAGLGATVHQDVRTEAPAKVEVVLQVAPEQHAAPEGAPIVLSRGGTIAASASLRPRKATTVRVRPGRYQISALAGKLCRADATISRAPLQRLVIRCG